MRHVITLLLIALNLEMLMAQGPDMVIPSPSQVQINAGVYSYAGIPDIKVKYDKDGMGAEDYELTVTPKGIRIKAGSDAGVFYAHQTLEQMTLGWTVTEIG
jgi:N-acetyl-beta-hexosaminidase